MSVRSRQSFSRRAKVSEAPLWLDLAAFGFGIAVSPLHITLLLLLLLGPRPRQRGLIYLLGWILTTLLTLVGLLTLGHGLVMDMTQGSQPRIGLDLLGSGALMTLGIRELVKTIGERDEPPAWARSLDRFIAMPLPLLLALSAVLEVISPDDLFLFAKSAARILAADLAWSQEFFGCLMFTLGSSLLLLVPVLAVLMAREDVLPMLKTMKTLLIKQGERLLACVSLFLGLYLGWQGFQGLTAA